MKEQLDEFVPLLDMDDIICLDGGYCRFPGVNSCIPHRKPKGKVLLLS